MRSLIFFISIIIASCLGSLTGNFINNTKSTKKRHASTTPAPNDTPISVQVGNYKIPSNLYSDLLNNALDTGHNENNPDYLNRLGLAEQNEILATHVREEALCQFISNNQSLHTGHASYFEKCLLKGNTTTDQQSHQKSTLSLRINCRKKCIHQYSNAVLVPNIRVKESEIDDYYQENINLFSTNERISIRQILLANEVEAASLIYKVTRDNFSRFAAKHSIAPEAYLGGKIPTFEKGTLPRVFDQFFTLRVGAVSGPIKSPYGFHIVLVEKKWLPSTLSKSSVHSLIKDKLFQEKKSAALKQLLQKALKTITIEEIHG